MASCFVGRGWGRCVGSWTARETCLARMSESVQRRKFIFCRGMGYGVQMYKAILQPCFNFAVVTLVFKIFFMPYHNNHKEKEVLIALSRSLYKYLR